MLSKRYETGTNLEQMAVNIEFNYLLRQLKVYIQGPLSFLKETTHLTGAQWLSGRVLDSRSEWLRVRTSPVALHCVLEQDT